MKRILGIALAAVMAFSAASAQAAGTFSNGILSNPSGDLISSFYTGSYSTGTQLNISTAFDFKATSLPTGTDRVTLYSGVDLLGQLGASSYSDVKFSTWGRAQLASNDYRIIGSNTGNVNPISSTQFTNAYNNMGAVEATNANADSDSDGFVTAPLNQSKNYGSSMATNGSQFGSLGNMWNTPINSRNGEISLAALDNGGDVWIRLYEFTATNAVGSNVAAVDSNTSDDLAASGYDAWVHIFVKDGLVTAELAPVPVPAAFWLLGSGIAGLIGLRRKAA